MPGSVMLAVALTMVATSFLSGIFGMAGGMVLLGVLLALLPLPDAMSLHAISQISSNGWRGLLWLRHVRWRASASFLIGCGLAFAIWSTWRYVPSKAVSLVLLGLSPFLVRIVPAGLKPDPERLTHGVIYGGASMILMLLAGVSGPLIDTFFLGGKFDRRQIVATKAVCQIASHGAKFVYFGGLVETAAEVNPAMAAIAVCASLVGTALARPILERLSEVQYRAWATRIITAIALTYLAQGAYLLLN